MKISQYIEKLKELWPMAYSAGYSQGFNDGIEAAKTLEYECKETNQNPVPRFSKKSGLELPEF